MTAKSVGALPIIAALLSAGITASPASAASAASALAAGPVGELTLTLTYADTGAVVSRVTLTCEPTGGTHPHAQAACDDLIPVNGQIANIPPESGVACPMYYLPVYATATGAWVGAADFYHKEFYNICAAAVETGGHVFDF